MKVENPVALRFILEDELYLLGTDKPLYEKKAIAESIIAESAPEIKTQTVAPVIDKPVPVIQAPQVVAPVIEVPQPEIKTQPLTFNYLGKNLKNFLILVNYPELEFIADAHLAALQNILKRKEFELHDVAIVNMAKHSEATLDSLINFFKPARLLLLGQAAVPQGFAQIGLNNPKVISGFPALYSFSFGEMMDSVDHKKAFWEQMKTL